MGHVIGEQENPRRGSMQFWPRCRAKRAFPRIRTYPIINEALLTSFTGYKVGMTHVMVIDNLKHSPTKGQEISVPVTIVECPPISIFSIRFYKKTPYGLKIITQINSDSYEKILYRKLKLKSKKPKEKKSKKQYTQKELLSLADDIVRVNVLIHTNPQLTSIGKKKPEIMEVILGGNKTEAINKAFELLGKQINVNDVFKEGEQIDTFSVTIGKGFQGSVKRFGLKLGRHKAEKVKRKAMSLGPWTPCKVLHTVPQHGQMGYQTRCDYNKWLLKIEEPAKVKIKGGYIKYGDPKNKVLILKGSIPGPKKRLIRLRKSIRPRKNIPVQPPQITYISTESKQ